jgi:hypothetical protein
MLPPLRARSNNTGQTLVKMGKMLIKYWSNTGQMLVKHWPSGEGEGGRSV